MSFLSLHIICIHACYRNTVVCHTTNFMLLCVTALLILCTCSTFTKWTWCHVTNVDIATNSLLSLADYATCTEKSLLYTIHAQKLICLCIVLLLCKYTQWLTSYGKQMTKLAIPVNDLFNQLGRPEVMDCRNVMFEWTQKCQFGMVYMN